MKLEGKRVFVSGGAGVIGRELCPLLLALGAQVTVGDLKPCPADWPAAIAYREGDLNDLTRAAYRWLYRLATDDADPASATIWEDWRRIEEQVSALAPVLRHLDRVADNLRFARWNPLGPLQSIPWLWHELKRQWPARRGSAGGGQT